MITSHPDAPEGEVRTLSSYTTADFPKGSAILCRNTAPLVAFAYSLLQKDIPCHVLGREIGAALIGIVTKMRATNLEDLSMRLTSWHQREVSRCESEGKSSERISDQYSCLTFFISALDSDSQSVRDLIAKIELLFADDRTGTKITLSTVHKAKGLEWTTVFILDFHKYMPSRFATLPWQQKQEKNLIYVAITRSKDKLFYINSNCWKEQNAR